MPSPLSKQIQELSDQARVHERFIYDNIGSPGWNEKGSRWNQEVSAWHASLFRLAQKRQELSFQDKPISYTPVRSLPRIINRSESVTR